MEYQVSEIKHISNEVQAKLVEMGVKTTDQLLAEAHEYNKRKSLAEKIGIDVRDVTELVNRADLMRIDGVGKEMANLLEECGVDSCKELQHRVPANLQAKMKETNDEHKIAHHAPTLAQVESWIKQAATLAAGDP